MIYYMSNSNVFKIDLMKHKNYISLFFCLLLGQLSLPACFTQQTKDQKTLKINDLEYLNVMLAHDYYPGGHQSGISIIQNGIRVGSDGDMRLEPTPRARACPA